MEFRVHLVKVAQPTEGRMNVNCTMQHHEPRIHSLHAICALVGSHSQYYLLTALEHETSSNVDAGVESSQCHLGILVAGTAEVALSCALAHASPSHRFR